MRAVDEVDSAIMEISAGADPQRRMGNQLDLVRGGIDLGDSLAQEQVRFSLGAADENPPALLVGGFAEGFIEVELGEKRSLGRIEDEEDFAVGDAVDHAGGAC